MGLPKEMENFLALKKQLKEITSKYYELWNDIEDMRSNLRIHFSTIVAAFLGIIASLHQTNSNRCIEWWFFICVALCTLSLACVLISTYENLRNSIKLRDVIKETCDKAIDTLTPLDMHSFASPRKKIYTILFGIGITCFGLAVLIFCLLNMPVWQ